MTPPAHLRFPRPSLMGVVNVTPDSFSDGGLFCDPDRAAARVSQLIADGAAIVDLGGESTRPGSEPVSLDEELRRVVPVLERLAGSAPLSIDSCKAEVARQALALGAELVNDVTALRGDPEMAGVVAFLEERLAFCVAAGIPEERVILDPGIGFGKTHEQNLALVRGLQSVVAIGRPVLVGLSRKSLLGRLLGGEERRRGSDAASVGAALFALEQGATLFRVHDVGFHADALTVAALLADG